MHTLTHDEAEAVLEALLEDEDAPTHYALTPGDIDTLATFYDWDSRVDESNWSRDTDYADLAAMVRAERGQFLADISSYYGDDYYTDRGDG